MASYLGRLSWMIYIYGTKSLEKCFILLLPAICNDVICVLKKYFLPDVELHPASPAVCSLKSHTSQLITCSKNRLWKQSKKYGKQRLFSAHVTVSPWLHYYFLKRTGQFPVIPNFRKTRFLEFITFETLSRKIISVESTENVHCPQASSLWDGITYSWLRGHIKTLIKRSSRQVQWVRHYFIFDGIAVAEGE